MEEIIIYKALYNYSPSDDEVIEGYIALKIDDLVQVTRTEKFEEENGGNVQVGPVDCSSTYSRVVKHCQTYQFYQTFSLQYTK